MSLKVLWIAPYLFYPPRAGGQFSIYPWAKELSRRGWKLFLVQYHSPWGFLSRSLERLDWAENVITIEPRRFQSNTEYLKRLILSSDSFLKIRNDVPDIYHKLKKIAEDFPPNFIIISHSYMGFLIPFLRKLFPWSKILIDLHNLEWRAYQNELSENDFLKRALALINYIRLKEEEKKALSSCDGIIFPSPVEGKFVAFFKKPLLWRPARFPEERILFEDELLRNRDVLLTSSLNVDFICEEILEFLKKAWLRYRKVFKNANFWLVGREPLNWFREKASKFEGVRLTGWVDDVSPYVRRSRIFVAPFKRTMGSLTKIISAWSWGLPVITTTIVAKGLKCEPGKHLLVGKDLDELLVCCLRVAKDDRLALSLAKEARELVDREYSLDIFINRFERWVRKLS